MSGKGPRGRWVWPARRAAIAFVYLYFVPYFPALNNPNENSRVYQIRAAVELHKLSVNEQIANHGWVNDLAMRDGVFYAGKAPGTTFLGVPIYAALRGASGSPVSDFRLLYALRLAGTLLPTLLFVAWFRSFTRRLVDDDRIANALALILALGTMLLSYAVIFVNHSLTAACAFGAVIATDAAARARQRVGIGRIPTGTWGWLFCAGFLLSFAAALDYALMPVSAALLLWIPVRFGVHWASTAGVWAGASLPALWTAVYHTLCWGSPFKLSVNHLANPQFAANQSQGLFGIVGPSKHVLFELILGPAKGLLYFSPIFALALLATITAMIRSRRRSDAVLSFVIVWGMLLYACSLTNWDAGWTVGPRYATVIVPFAMYSLALCWSTLGNVSRGVLLPLAMGTGLLGMLVMTGTSVTFPHLPPDYRNPVLELIWPLWRDGVVPYNFGLRWLGLSGRAAQLPMLTVMGLLLLYAVRVASGWGITHRRWYAAVGSVVVALGIFAGGLKLGAIPRTQPVSRVHLGSAWLREVVWFPPLHAPGNAPRLPFRRPGQLPR